MRQLFRMLALLPCAVVMSAMAVDGTNLPGSDYANFDAPSAFVCRTSCGGEANCQAYTWVKPGIQGPVGHCWLKHAEPDIVKDNCCDSGPRRFIEKTDLRAEDHIDRPGSDYRNFEVASWTNCESACTTESACSSWTYVRPGVQGPSGRCWLKNHVARPVANANAVSGVKFKPAPVRGTCTLYEHRDFGGAHYVLGNGAVMYMISNPDPSIGTSDGIHSFIYEPSWNDKLSSFKVQGGCTLTLWEHVNHGGHHFTSNESYAYVGDRWNDKASQADCSCPGLPNF